VIENGYFPFLLVILIGGKTLDFDDKDVLDADTVTVWPGGRAVVVPL